MAGRNRKGLPSLFCVLALLLVAACVVPSPERQLLRDFFSACRAYDTTAMARFGTAPCNPRTDGVVEDFEIVDRGSTDVTIAARVRPLGGAPADQMFRVSLERKDGRLVVSGLTRLPASQISPEASSAPLN